MRTPSWIAALALTCAACGGGVPPPGPPPTGPVAGPDLTTALAPMAWLVGDWAREDVAYGEHFVAIAGAIYGAGMGDDDANWEAMVIDDADLDGAAPGQAGLIARPRGAPPVTFLRTGGDAARVRFENPAHDFPTWIEYAVVRGALHATIGGPDGDPITVELARRAGERAPEVEAADAARPRPLAAVPVDDDAELRWEPSWSRRSPTGRVAATAGRTRVVERGGVTWRGSYLTVWRQDAGGWTPLVDVVRTEHPLGAGR